MKIGFLDFWYDFDVNNNFFYHTMKTLKENVTVSSPEDCDILFFSCFGESNNLPQFQNKKRIFYTGENLRPVYDNNVIRNAHNFTGRCDISLSFDFEEHDGRNIRLPLWLLQIDWYNKVNFTNPQFMIPYDQIYENEFIKKSKDKFCCIVFNSPSPYRYEIIEELSKYKKVDCFGKPFGNWFNGEDVKLNVISDYKFNICFENTLHPGYYTEKLIHAKVAGCIPVYWAEKTISNDFNDKSFINLYDFNGVKDLVEYIIQVDQDDQIADKYKSEKMFNDDQDPKKLFDNIYGKIKEKVTNL
jgi:hypothetical protein